MKLSRATSLAMVLLAFLGVGCGGAAEDGGRDDGATRPDDDDGAEASADADDPDANEDGDGADDGDGNDGDGSDGDSATGDPGSSTSEDPGAVSMPGMPPSTGGGIAPAPVTPSRPPMAAPPGIGLPAPGSSGEPLPPAEDCATEFESVGTDYCEVQQACTDDFVYTSCYADGTGAYGCSCSRNVGYVNHRLTGVDATTACTLAVELCSGQLVPEYAEESVCTQAAQSVGTDYCDTQIACTKSADLGDGVIAELATDYQSGSCWNQGDGSLSCSCSAGGTYQSYVLSGIAVAESCGLVLDFCLSGEAPEFSEPATCSLANAYQQTNGSNSYCQLEQICSQSSEVSPGVFAALTESDYVSCDTTSESSLCYCSGNTRSLRFALSSTEATACNDALAICASTAEIVPDGPLSCQRSFQNGSGAYCDTTFDCTQDAVVEGTTVGVYGSYSAFCQDAGDGSWSCSCSSGTEVAEITVSAEDAWAACTDAGELCGDAVGVQIGSSSGGVIIVGGGAVGGATPAPRPL